MTKEILKHVLLSGREIEMTTHIGKRYRVRDGKVEVAFYGVKVEDLARDQVPVVSSWKPSGYTLDELLVEMKKCPEWNLLTEMLEEKSQKEQKLPITKYCVQFKRTNIVGEHLDSVLEKLLEMAAQSGEYEGYEVTFERKGADVVIVMYQIPGKAYISYVVKAEDFLEV